MKRIRVAQQYVDNSNIGGLKTEYTACSRRNALKSDYEFIPVVLTHCHTGISLSDIRFYRRKFREADADMIHIRGAGVESLNAVLGAKLAGRGRVLVTVHGMFSDLVYYSAVKRWICRYVIERLIFGLADGISCVYEQASRRENFRSYQKKMLPHVYNRMPVYTACEEGEKQRLREQLSIPPSSVVGVFTGRITEEKGLCYLCEALERMDRQWPEGFVLLLIGDGAYHRSMQERCAKLEHRGQICFVGQQDCVETYLKASDFFLSPSLHENLSIAVLEACAAQLPCVVTDVGGNPEIIQNNGNGLLIRPFSVDEIIRGIRSMCDDTFRKELRERAAHIDMSRFSDAQVDSQLMRVYEQLMQRKGQR